jgi:hypothetical protein
MSIFTNPASGSKENAPAYTAGILGLLGAQKPVSVLGKTEARLRKSIKGLTPRLLRRREAPGKWSIAHVMQHLVDSEIVWSWRMRLILAQDRPPLTGYDQDAWADRLGYERTDVRRAIEEFAVLRAANLRLLRRAKPEDLKRVGVHSERGEESIEHLMRLYAGHDLLHLRQIERIRTGVS